MNIQFKKFINQKQSQHTPKSIFSCICKSKSVYKHMGQQDAQELLGVILNQLIDGEKDIMIENNQL